MGIHWKHPTLSSSFEEFSKNQRKVASSDAHSPRWRGFNDVSCSLGKCLCCFNNHDCIQTIDIFQINTCLYWAKPRSATTVRPVPFQCLLRCNVVAVFTPISAAYSRWLFSSKPAYSSMCRTIGESRSQIVWNSFPAGRGFLLIFFFARNVRW